MSIVEDLIALGVRPGDLVMVHASLRAIGPVEGGADGLLDALGEVLGPDGTLLMNVSSGEIDGAFDALRTPAAADLGVLAEVFRTRPGTLVSDHPEGRFGAAGGRAEELVSEVPWDDYYGPGSPLQRLVDEGGRVLRLGADPDTVTLLHYAEYLADVPNKRRAHREPLVATAGGERRVVVECLDDENGIVDHPGEDYFATILHEYLATGRASQGRVGNARSELIDGADLVDFGARWMEENLRTD